jgi:hypothetical protein
LRLIFILEGFGEQIFDTRGGDEFKEPRSRCRPNRANVPTIGADITSWDRVLIAIFD